ncbi:uncharacterized protein LOC126891496 [Diabrotica virgifera virgifera]|uniref:Uncharacterized protein n=1 Tax=Diabrotica virgifera virgifera TaxID=50390 RepID=A0ABM5L2H2_DIAVI|nr:uncharacterized protein LOC126891496 [Diabrotica virgifera virgifera]
MLSLESTELSPSNSAHNVEKPTLPESLSKSEHESSDDNASGDESAPRASSPKSEMEEEYSSSEDESMIDDKFSEEEIKEIYKDLPQVTETPQVSEITSQTRDSETPQVSNPTEFDKANAYSRRIEEKQSNKRPRNPSSPTQEQLKKAKDVDGMQQTIEELFAKLQENEVERRQDQARHSQQIAELMDELKKLRTMLEQKDQENRELVAQLVKLTDRSNPTPTPSEPESEPNLEVAEMDTEEVVDSGSESTYRFPKYRKKKGACKKPIQEPEHGKSSVKDAQPEAT